MSELTGISKSVIDAAVEKSSCDDHAGLVDMLNESDTFVAAGMMTAEAFGVPTHNVLAIMTMGYLIGFYVGTSE